MSLIQININNAADAINARNALMAFLGDFSTPDKSGPEVTKGESFAVKTYDDPVETSGEAFMAETQEKEEPESAEEDVFGSGEEIDIFENQAADHEKEEPAPQTEIDVSTLNLDKQRYTKDDRALIESACRQHGIAFDSKISTPNLAKKLKKTLGGEPEPSAPAPEKQEANAAPKVTDEALREATKACIAATSKETFFNELESRFGEKLLSKIDKTKYGTVMSLCKAFMALKQVIDKKGKGEAVKLLALIGGPDCKKLSSVGDDKLAPLTSACGEVLNKG